MHPDPLPDEPQTAITADGKIEINLEFLVRRVKEFAQSRRTKKHTNSRASGDQVPLDTSTRVERNGHIMTTHTTHDTRHTTHNTQHVFCMKRGPRVSATTILLKVPRCFLLSSLVRRKTAQLCRLPSTSLWSLGLKDVHYECPASAQVVRLGQCSGLQAGSRCVPEL